MAQRRERGQVGLAHLSGELDTPQCAAVPSLQAALAALATFANFATIPTARAAPKGVVPRLPEN